MQPIATEWSAALIDVTIKATLLLMLAATIGILSRRASASYRHLVWALGLGCVLFLPLLSQTLPHWRVPVRAPVTRHSSVRENAARTRPSPSIGASQAAAHSVSSPATVDPTPPAVTEAMDGPRTAAPLASARFPWSAVAFCVWMAGCGIVLMRLVVALARLRGAASASIAADNTSINAILSSAASDMRIRRPIALRIAAPGRVTVPLTWGSWRPVVILPAEAAASWPEGRLRAALLHELAHVRRWDWPLQIVAQFACALYWFHPLVWLAARQMRAESETACDDLVLASGMPATDYARHLLDVALAARDQRRLGAAVAMAQSPKIEGRLRTVLASGLRRGGIGRRLALTALTAALLVSLPLAALRVGAKPQGWWSSLPNVPEADRLQLHEGFTLRYAVTITDLTTPQMQRREYEQLRADYTALLKKDPHYQPVPAEFYAPFSYFQSRRPKIRHAILTVSAQNGHLLWRQEENGHSFTLDYDGRNGTQLFSDRHAGRVEPGLQFDEMSECPLPAVGLPYVPLIQKASLAASSGAYQTWQGQFPQENEEIEQGKVVFSDGIAHAALDDGTWKILDVDSSDQQWQYIQHRRFQGLWLASEMRLTEYRSDALPAVMPQLASQEDFMRFCNRHRTATRVCDYHLLAAGDTPAQAPQVTLPNGATVRLLGVADTQAVGSTHWWAADGRPVAGTLPQNTLHYPTLPPGVQGRAVAIAASYDVAAQSDSIWVAPPPRSWAYTRAESSHGLYYIKPNSTWWVEPDEHLKGLDHYQLQDQLQESRYGSQATQMTVLAVSSRTSDKTATVRYAVAAGPWTESVTCAKKPGKVVLGMPSGQVIFTLISNPHHLMDPKVIASGDARFMVSDHFRTHSPLEADNPLQIALHDGENYERAVYGLDRSGRVIVEVIGGMLTLPDGPAGDYRLIKTMQEAAIPNSVLKRVASFRLVARPYQWAVFRDVPLQPRRVSSQ